MSLALASPKRQVEHVVDHFLLIGFDHAVFMADIYDGPKLILGQALFLRIRIYPEQEHDSS